MKTTITLEIVQAPQPKKAKTKKQIYKRIGKVKYAIERIEFIKSTSINPDVVSGLDQALRVLRNL